MSSTPDLPPNSAVSVDYEFTVDLPLLLERLNISLILSTYQAGRVVTIGTHEQLPRVGFSYFEQAMGVTRTSTGLAIGCRHAVWTLPANRAIAPRIPPEDQHDIAFLARTCHQTGPLMVHDLAWAGDRLWVVNTLFNCLATLESPWNFQPRWKPPFISEIAPGDRCHLNGVAIAEDGSTPIWASALAVTNEDQGWRDQKTTGGCLIHVPSGDLVLEGLCMPHSPRLHQGQLYLLNSGLGTLVRVDPSNGDQSIVVQLPGFTRGLDCFAGHAFVGLSQIRESAIFGGSPIQETSQELRCGVAMVDLSTGVIEGMFWFRSGVEEVFAVTVLPGYRDPVVIGPDTQTDHTKTIWIVPPQEDGHILS
jgi:uncharacterized protein (TIGR03032 family)